MTITEEVINNYKRNKKWLEWFLERHKAFLSGLDFGHGGTEPSKEQIEVIKTYFTEQEQKIISWGLSYSYMLEKFHSHCLKIAPNLSLIDFQKLCYSWWASKEEETSHKELANKGKLNSEQWEELNKFLKEEEFKKGITSANDFFERKLEEWLTQEISEPKLREYHREYDPEKRAEILKERDIEIRNYRKKRLSEIEEYYKKNKNIFPELNKLLEEKIKEETREVKVWERVIEETDYLEWSKRTMKH